MGVTNGAAMMPGFQGLNQRGGMMDQASYSNMMNGRDDMKM